ncbi:ECF transporter S component [Facklamia sp. DSM 111018]|uniref:ECF transporter S component n=1 Tax=Facklamia lactis TaxID=2749967 RepID=A0ABS0LS27_9LACT|nr:CD3073 family putative ECF transporter S component [Facklamia lactis]MBG9981167.1 ECF transporter S component [Facklamia lactis]MBG9986968.1 ECF transporter S component [Facklamia lactis]
MKNKQSRIKIITLCALAIAINVVIGRTVSALSIPLLFLDTMGTIFIAANFGIFWGVLTGLSTNLLAAVLGGGAVEIPFSLVSIAVAIIVALISNGKFSYIKAIIAGILMGLIAPAVGTVIRLTLFGGFTGSGTDIFIAALRASGQSMFTSTFLATVVSNMVDKIVSCLIVSWISQMPAIRKHLV